MSAVALRVVDGENDGLVPPNDLPAERAVISAVLLNEGAILRVVDFLRAENFYSEAHRRIFEAALAVRESGQPVDPQTVRSRLSATKRLAQVGGDEYLVELVGSVPVVANVRAHATAVFECWRARQVQGICSRAVAQAYRSVPDVQAFSETVARGVAELARMKPGGRVESNIETLRRLVRQIERAEAGQTDEDDTLVIPTGIEEWDHHMLGLYAGQKTTIVAHPRVGKTALALQFAMAGANAGVASAFFSTEMSRDELGLRQLSNLARVNGRRLKLGMQKPNVLKTEEWHRIRDALGVVARMKAMIHVFDETSPTVEDICAKVKALAEQSVVVDGAPLGLVFVDYVQKLSASQVVSHKKKYEQVGHATERLKDLAREANVAVVELAQQKNVERDRSGKRPHPQLGEAAESYQIERSADNVAYLFRPDEKSGNEVRIFIAKQRSGEEPEFDLTFEREFSRFVSPDPYGPGTALSRQYVDTGEGEGA